MPLNSADQLRFFLSDKPRFLVETKYGDGTASAFQLSGVPLVSGATALGAFQPSAFVPVGAGGGTAWSATGAAFNYHLGTVSFSGAISANSAYQASYTYATFSDQEIDLVTGMYSDMPSMRLALINNLMGDAYKRASWRSQAGASYDDSETMKNLMLMRSAILAERTDEQGPIGDIFSWSTEQQNYE